MHNPLNNVKQAAEHIRLSHDEKEVMRAKIFAAIDAAKYAPVPPATRIRTMYSWVSLRYATSLALLVVFVLGGGTAYAAEGALPGGILYPVKVNVNEKVAEALATSPEAKISFHASRAAERLKEAEALAAQGKLDATTTAQLEANFDTHVAQAETLTEELEHNDEGAALEASVRLDSSLAAHGAILARLGEESNDSPTRENSNRVAQRVLARGSVAMRAPAAMMLKASGASEAALDTTASSESGEDTHADDSSERSATARVAPEVATKEMPMLTQEATMVQQEFVDTLREKAHKALEDVQDTFDDADPLSATTSAHVQGTLDELSERLEGGSAQLEAEDFASARESFTAVLRGAVELSTLLEASGEYKRDFFNGRDSEPEDTGEDSHQDESSLKTKVNLGL